jgi:hypothetical protein
MYVSLTLRIKPLTRFDCQSSVRSENFPHDKSFNVCDSVSVNTSENTIYNGPTNALVCNKTLIQMSHTKTLKITPTFFDHQMIIIRELFDPG